VSESRCSVPEPASSAGTQQLERLAELARALGDPTRLAILRRLVTSPHPIWVGFLVELLPVKQPTVSHHLRVLRKAGLVVAERRGTWSYYRATALGRAALHALQRLELHAEDP
jgi:ArsR family transcriptional regulator